MGKYELGNRWLKVLRKHWVQLGLGVLGPNSEQSIVNMPLLTPTLPSTCLDYHAPIYAPFAVSYSPDLIGGERMLFS